MEPSTAPPPTPSGQPHLTPQFCLNTTALRDFLRLSRSTVDDSVSLHLNSLLQPSSIPFLPSSTSVRSLSPSSSRRQIPGSVCRTFKQNILFASWQARDDVLRYCNGVADAPNDPPPPPPLTSRRRMAMPSDKQDSPMIKGLGPYDDGQSPQRRRTRNYWGEEQDVDERTDPYSGRDYSYTREPKAQMLKDVLVNEEGVERIIRARTWSMLGERCLDGEGEGSGGGGYEEEWAAWRDSIER